VALWLLACHALGRIAERCLGVSARATAVLAALWPPMIVYALSYHPLILRAGCLIAVLSALLAYRDRPSWRRAALLGLALGAAALVRTMFLLLPIPILWLALSNAGSERGELVRTRLAHGVLAVGLCVLVLSPWVVRNALVLGAFIPGTTTAGYTAYLGNHPGASGALTAEARDRALALLPPGFFERPEPVVDRELRARVASFVHERPAEAARLWLRKLSFLATWYPEVGWRYPSRFALLYKALWAIALPAILLGWWWARKRGQERPDLLGALALALLLVYSCFVVNLRYRFEVEPLLLGYLVVFADSVRAIIVRRGVASSSEGEPRRPSSARRGQAP
jgi:hypothetical protein